MALIFNRLAHNYAKRGYYPTDDVTLARIMAAIEPPTTPARIIDPCCGTGLAVAQLGEHLATEGSAVETLGIEIDAERASLAKSMLSRVIQADRADVVIPPRSCGVLILNPPYGEGVAHQIEGADAVDTQRMEFTFLQRTVHCLMRGGLLVLIVPYYALDKSMAALLANNFDRLRVFMAPEKQFKQAVVFGVRSRYREASAARIEPLLSFGRREHLDEELPEQWQEERYAVPSSEHAEQGTMHAIRIDRAQLAEELRRLRLNTLWSNFDTMFVRTAQTPRSPLCELSQWHLALALATGQITGVVGNRDLSLLIKGDTFKRKVRSVERTVDDDGNVSETVILTDTFVAVIRGIVVTPGPRLGDVVTIR